MSSFLTLERQFLLLSFFKGPKNIIKVSKEKYPFGFTIQKMLASKDCLQSWSNEWPSTDLWLHKTHCSATEAQTPTTNSTVKGPLTISLLQKQQQQSFKANCLDLTKWSLHARALSSSVPGWRKMFACVFWLACWIFPTIFWTLVGFFSWIN